MRSTGVAGERSTGSGKVRMGKTATALLCRAAG
jgi:hypothetical protein